VYVLASRQIADYKTIKITRRLMFPRKWATNWIAECSLSRGEADKRQRRQPVVIRLARM